MVAHCLYQTSLCSERPGMSRGGLALDPFSSPCPLLSTIFQLGLFHEASQENGPIGSRSVVLRETGVLDRAGKYRRGASITWAPEFGSRVQLGLEPSVVSRDSGGIR